MPGYVAIPERGTPPRADADDWAAPHFTIVVLEEDHSPVSTGLVDARGVPIYRIADRVPMGFRCHAGR